MRILPTILFLLAAGPSPLTALEWKTTEIHLQAGLGQEQAAGVFLFRNTQNKPVRILSVFADCHCVAARPEKDVYAPGESGEIRAEFVFAGRVGRQIKTITVVSDEPGGKAASLTLTVDIPEPVVVNPRFLFWPTGGPPAERSLEIIVTEPKQTEIGELQCSNPFFSARLQPEQAGRYRLLIKPSGTQQPAEATIRLNVTVAGRPQSYQVYVAVR
ncbi:MAG: DUF1573 domain-containing protein [Opitutaceae bacterium]|nr:DUF1573 domain-containing protein [Opitutaceae bacterium]